MNLDASLERLFRRNLHIIKLDLEPMRALMRLLDNPQDRLLCVHVAGTNGKGSVCAMLASIFRQGYRTGLYTSPHLVRFNERIRVDGAMITDDELATYIAEVESAAARLPGLGYRDVTFFEFTTALAFLYFVRRAVQIVALETGLGGRLDATNIIIPAASVITTIGLEHTAYLGDTLAAIAGEKAGIIKPGRPVIAGPLADEAMTVIAETAQRHHAPLRVAADQVTTAVRSSSLSGQKLHIDGELASYGLVNLPLPGPHQAVNAAIAVATSECLAAEVGVPVTTEAIRNGLAQTEWPGRGQLIRETPPIIVDGAHNPEAAAALAGWLRKAAGKKPIGLVAAFLADKDPAAFVRAFRGKIQRVWTVPLPTHRAMAADEVARRLSVVPGHEAAASIASALTAASAWAIRENGIVVVAGSLYLVGEVLESSGLSEHLLSNKLG